MDKKKVLSIILALLCILGAFCAIYFPNLNDEIGQAQNAVIEEIQAEEENEVVITDETQAIVNETIEAVENGEDLSTTEEITSTEEEEQNLEGELESDAQVEQENISYDGDITGNGLSLLGAYQGLTYYSQLDSRWSSIMYSSTGNTSQTIGSSGCGPSSAAIVVSSSKGTILPSTMASLAVSNGYRTANNGTAWAFYSFVADYFDFSEYHSTSNFDTMLSYLTQKDENGNSKYYVIVSCGSGLFTTGGHYIVLVADNDNTITVYDPYLYSGKFSTASRKAAGIVISGNNVYVTESAFKTYANAKNYWIFSNDEGEGNTNTASSVTEENSTVVNYTRYVSTQSANLNVRDSANGNKIGSIAKGTAVTVTKVDGNWSYITSPVAGWVSSSYLSSTKVTTTSTTTSYSSTVGSYYRLNSKSYIYSNSNLTGTKYTYLANTQIKVLSHISSNVDYVQVVKTGRKGYINVSNYSTATSTVSTTATNTIGQYKRLASKTTLYSKSNLTGTKYTYLANTQVKIIKNISSTVDYVYVVKTGRYAYVKNSSYK